MSQSNIWSEQELIKAFSAKGQLKEKATQYVINNFIHYLPSVAKKTGLEKDLALDAYTDAIMDMIDKVADGTFKGDSKLTTYFYKIFHYKCIDLSRKKSTNKIDYRDNLPDLTDSEPRAVKAMEIAEDMNRLQKYLTQLGEPCNQILLDWGYWGYNMNEIANRVGLAGSTQAKDRKYKCLQKLRKLMN